MRMRLNVFLTAAAVLVGLSLPAVADSAAKIETVRALEAGTLAAGAAKLAEMIVQNDRNDDARFGLGMIRFLQAVEHLSQGLYKYGLQPPRSFLMPIVRLPVPENPNPEPVDYEKFRLLLLNFVADMQTAADTFEVIHFGESDLKVIVNLAELRYDGDGNGSVAPEERLTDVLARYLEIDPEELGQAPMVVAFDRADAFWFRGYANVLMAFGEFLLAHDWHESFDASFHIFFPKAHSPFQEALAGPEDEGDSFFSSEAAIFDLVSFLHICWPVKEPERMAAAREHLKAMLQISRDDWFAIRAETDDDREWIPGPGQTGATGAVVTTDQVEAWHKVLDEADALLDGKKLMPHWRFNQGFNLRRVFDEPRPFDFVLWITGPAAFAYLEDGPVLTSEEWGEIIEAFGDNFGSYAIWFN